MPRPSLLKRKNKYPPNKSYGLYNVFCHWALLHISAIFWSHYNFMKSQRLYIYLWNYKIMPLVLTSYFHYCTKVQRYTCTCTKEEKYPFPFSGNQQKWKIQSVWNCNIEKKAIASLKINEKSVKKTIILSRLRILFLHSDRRLGRWSFINSSKV